jgi:hypothetical protein
MNSKLIAVLVIFLSVTIWDVNSRLTWNAKTSSAQESKSAINIQLPRKLTTQQQNELALQYLTYNSDVVDTESIPEQGMSLEDQNLQNGRLDQLYAGDLRIRLSAVIRQADASSASEPLIFALLSVQNIQETHQSLQKIQVAEQFHGYKVKNIQLNQISMVSLNDVNRVITLAIYQKRAAPSSEPTLNRKSL